MTVLIGVLRDLQSGKAIKINQSSMFSTSLQFQQMKKQMQLKQSRPQHLHTIKTLNTSKWRVLMQQNLSMLSLNPDYSKPAIRLLESTICSIKEDNFVEAAIHMRSLKPIIRQKFKAAEQAKQSFTRSLHRKISSKGKELHDEATTSDTFHRMEDPEVVEAPFEVGKKDFDVEIIRRELNKEYHPFHITISNFSAYLENKWKSKNESDVDQVVSAVTVEFRLLEKFFRMSSQPLNDLYDLPDSSTRSKYLDSLHSMLADYISTHETLCGTVKRILKYYTQKSKEHKEFLNNCGQLADIDAFGVPEEYKIQGCFFLTTNELIELSRATRGREILTRLAEVRHCLHNDYDEYHRRNGRKGVKVELGTDAQLQIFKFLLAKLKIFTAELISALRVAEVIFGGDEMSYVFGQASFISSQLSIAYQAVQMGI